MLRQEAIPRQSPDTSASLHGDFADFLLIFGAGIYFCLQQAGQFWPLFAPGYALLAPFLAFLVLSVGGDPTIKRITQSMAAFHLLLAAAPLSWMLPLKLPWSLLRLDAIYLYSAFLAAATFVARCLGVELWDGIKNQQSRAILLPPVALATALTIVSVPLTLAHTDFSRYVLILWLFLIPFGALFIGVLRFAPAVGGPGLCCAEQLRRLLPPWLGLVIILVCSGVGLNIIRAMRALALADPGKFGLASLEQGQLMWLPAHCILVVNMLLLVKLSLWANRRAP